MPKYELTVYDKAGKKVSGKYDFLEFFARLIFALEQMERRPGIAVIGVER